MHGGAPSTRSWHPLETRPSQSHHGHIGPVRGVQPRRCRGAHLAASWRSINFLLFTPAGDQNIMHRAGHRSRPARPIICMYIDSEPVGPQFTTRRTSFLFTPSPNAVVAMITGTLPSANCCPARARASCDSAAEYPATCAHTPWCRRPKARVSKTPKGTQGYPRVHAMTTF